jgi:hypothetical protein
MGRELELGEAQTTHSVKSIKVPISIFEPALHGGVTQIVPNSAVEKLNLVQRVPVLADTIYHCFKQPSGQTIDLRHDSLLECHNFIVGEVRSGVSERKPRIIELTQPI